MNWRAKCVLEWVGKKLHGEESEELKICDRKKIRVNLNEEARPKELCNYI